MIFSSCEDIEINILNNLLPKCCHVTYVNSSIAKKVNDIVLCIIIIHNFDKLHNISTELKWTELYRQIKPFI